MPAHTQTPKFVYDVDSSWVVQTIPIWESALVYFLNCYKVWGWRWSQAPARCGDAQRGRGGERRRGSFPEWDMHATTSMTRWLDYLFEYLAFYNNNEKLPNCIIFTKVGLKFVQIVIKLSENCQRLFKCSQSGETSPKLVTLATTNSIQVHICQSYSGFRNLPMLSLLEIESFYLRQCAWKNKYVLPKW